MSAPSLHKFLAFLFLSTSALLDIIPSTMPSYAIWCSSGASMVDLLFTITSDIRFVGGPTKILRHVFRLNGSSKNRLHSHTCFIPTYIITCIFLNIFIAVQAVWLSANEKFDIYRRDEIYRFFKINLRGFHVRLYILFPPLRRSCTAANRDLLIIIIYRVLYTCVMCRNYE